MDIEADPSGRICADHRPAHAGARWPRRPRDGVASRATPRRPGAVFKGQNSHGHEVVDHHMHHHRRRTGPGVRFRRPQRSSCPSRIGATTSSRQATAAARSPSGPGTVVPDGSACPRAWAPASRTASANAEAHQAHSAAAEGEGRSARSRRRRHHGPLRRDSGPAGDPVGDDGDRRGRARGRATRASRRPCRRDTSRARPATATARVPSCVTGARPMAAP